jgi:DNA-binding IclR family transcriptional regulator
MSDTPVAAVTAVETAFTVVDHLETAGWCGVTELANGVGMPKSTVHKHLQTLRRQGYVKQVDGEYKLSLKFLQHGGVVRDRSRFYSFGRSKVESLAAELNEMTILSVCERNRGVFLFRSNDRYNLHESLPLGTEFYLHQNAAGKAMLAESGETFVEEVVDEVSLPGKTDATITDREHLLDELAAVSDRGYALNRGERDRNVSAVSAALEDPTTGNVGAISVTVPRDSPTSEHLDGEYAESVRRSASELSLQLEHN